MTTMTTPYGEFSVTFYSNANFHINHTIAYSNMNYELSKCLEALKQDTNISIQSGEGFSLKINSIEYKSLIANVRLTHDQSRVHSIYYTTKSNDRSITVKAQKKISEQFDKLFTDYINENISNLLKYQRSHFIQKARETLQDVISNCNETLEKLEALPA